MRIRSVLVQLCTPLYRGAVEIMTAARHQPGPAGARRAALPTTEKQGMGNSPRDTRVQPRFGGRQPQRGCQADEVRRPRCCTSVWKRAGSNRQRHGTEATVRSSSYYTTLSPKSLQLP